MKPVLRTVACSDGATLAVRDWNPAGERPAIVLHHGFAANMAWNWESPGIVDALAATGRRVIAFDARCHGESEKILDPARLTRARLARDVTEIADEAGLGPYDLAGYSLGGFISVIVAVRDSRVRRLAICGSCDQLFLDQLADQGMRYVPAALRSDDPKEVPAKVARGFRRFADATGSDRMALAACFEGINGSDWRSSGEAVPLIRVPTLVIGGRDDFIMVGVERLTDVIPGAQMVWTSGDHFTALDDPAFATSLVQFFTVATPSP